MASFQSFSELSWLIFLAFLAAVGFALFRETWRARKSRSHMAATLADANENSGPIVLPVNQEDPDLIEYTVVSRHIADLMLADEWTEIGDRIAEWEASLASTPGGQRYHDIATEMALSGLQSLIDAMPRDDMTDLADAEIELGYFLDTYRRATDNHVLALLAARAHLVIGEACRGDQWPESASPDAWRRMAHHFVEAGEILHDYDALAHMSPLLAEAHYLQALGSPGGAKTLAELFDSWISLDPANPAIFEKHAEFLCDTQAASDETILAEADRALERTEDTLGFGGYALFFLPLLDQRQGARNLLDPDLFASAMLDLATMSASQAEVNQTANALAAEQRASGAASIALADTLLMLVRGHLEVIYPRLWTMPLGAVQALIADASEAIPDALPELPANDTHNSISQAA